MVKKKEKTTFLKKNRHRIRIYSFILLYLQYQKIYIIDFSILNLITKFKDYGNYSGRFAVLIL